MRRRTVIIPIVIVVVFIFLCLVAAVLTEKKGDKTSVRKVTQDTGGYVDLDAALGWDGKVFTVSNRGNADWTSVEVEINAGLVTSGYTMKVSRIGAGRSVTLRARDFAKPDGEIFNPKTHRPQKVSILCTIRRQKGFWLGTLG